jgi:hypothetical protein
MQTKSCEELIQEETEIAKQFSSITIPFVLQYIKQAWWQNNLLMVQYQGEWSTPTIANDKEYRLLVKQNEN